MHSGFSYRQLKNYIRPKKKEEESPMQVLIKLLHNLYIHIYYENNKTNEICITFYGGIFFFIK